MIIKIPQKVYLKFKYFIDNTLGEISGMAKTSINEDGDIVINDAIIFKQECTSAHTELDDGAQAKFMYEMHKAGEDLKDWNLWWHSHANMGVFWSSMDDDTIKSLKDSSGENRNDFLISVVMNKKKEVLARVDIFPEDKSPFNIKSVHTMNNIKVEVEEVENEEAEKELTKLLEKEKLIKQAIENLIKSVDNDPDIEAACKKEIEEKVNTTTHAYGRTKGYSFGKKDWDEEAADYTGQRSFEKELDKLNGDKEDILDMTNSVICLSCGKRVDFLDEKFNIYGEPADTHNCPHCNCGMMQEYNYVWDGNYGADNENEQEEDETGEYFVITCKTCGEKTSVRYGFEGPKKCPTCFTPFKKKEQSLFGD